MRLLIAFVSVAAAALAQDGGPVCFSASERSQPAPGIYEAVPDTGEVHLLVRDRTAPARETARREGRLFRADDSICNSAGFHFWLQNNQGVFETGDRVGITRGLRANVQIPGRATIRLLDGNAKVAESTGSRLTYDITAPGEYSVQVLFGDRVWITSEPIRVEPSVERRITFPRVDETGIERFGDLTYVEGEAADEEKHRLDVYAPKERTGTLPVFIFLHGGSWRSGDRSSYKPFGARFAREGMIVVVPSYRLSPKNVHPAHLDDVTAAFKWVLGNIEQYGGDPNRVFLGGHSAGGHLVSLLAMRTEPGLIKGVITMSGVYDVTSPLFFFAFTADEQVRREASPVFHIRPDAPRFVVTYCQWDYPTLPAQAKNFHKRLEEAGVASELVYVPRETHISEIVSTLEETDPTAKAILSLVLGGR